MIVCCKEQSTRLDGFQNSDHPSESQPGSAVLTLRGDPVAPQQYRGMWDLDDAGHVMPSADVVRAGQVEPLSDRDRRTILRWIDLGCPVDLDYDPNDPRRCGFGWSCDDDRPVLTLSLPRPGSNRAPRRILLCGHDDRTGLALTSFEVLADFASGETASATNRAHAFRQTFQGVWELKLETPLASRKHAKLTVSVKDRQGNINRIVRRFSSIP